MSVRFVVTTVQDGNGWVASVSGRSGAQSRGQTLSGALAGALRSLAEQVERGEPLPEEVESAEDEHERLAEAGAKLAAEQWGSEDFSDWEDFGGDSGAR